MTRRTDVLKSVFISISYPFAPGERFPLPENLLLRSREQGLSPDLEALHGLAISVVDGLSRSLMSDNLRSQFSTFKGR